MATTEEIRRRVEEADTARSARRSAVAQQVGELAQRRAAIAEQLADVERQLGDALAAARDVIEVDELARFTDVPAADLNRWRNGRKPTRSRRHRPATGTSGGQGGTGRGPAVARTPPASQASTSPERATSRATAADKSARVPAEVT